MDKYAKLNEVFKNAFSQKTGAQLIVGTLKAITDNTCTVEINEGLQLTDVRLKIDVADSNNRLMIFPKVDSLVLMGSLTGDMKDLAIIKCEQIERIEYCQDGTIIKIDSTDGKVSIENESVSLKGLFQQLTDLLKQFKVFTPAGPSGAPLPDTILALTSFETSFKQLLK